MVLFLLDMFATTLKSSEQRDNASNENSILEVKYLINLVCIVFSFYLFYFFLCKPFDSYLESSFKSKFKSLAVLLT